MLNHRFKIVLSILLSFIIVQGITYFSENPEVASVQAENMKGMLSGLKFNASSLTKLFSLNIGPPTDSPEPQGSVDPGSNSLNLPSISNPPTPTETQSQSLPTAPILSRAPTSAVTRGAPTPTRYLSPTPTKKPVPTNTPKPTATPKPAAITADARPGSTMEEIFEEVGKRTCFPPALIRAFQDQESGAFFKYSNPPSVIKIYNTYGWWKTGAGDPCFGLGYHTQTGIVPSDSVKAGTQCRNAVGNPTDIKIMGIIQISEWEQEVSRKHTIAHLPKNIDRRVLFDNALIFAYITRSRVGNPPKDCNNWPDDAVKTAAEKHHGVCVYDYGTGNAGNYCTKILQLYKEYK